MSARQSRRAGSSHTGTGLTGGKDSAEHVRVRLAEDERALAVAGAEWINLEYLDKHYCVRYGWPGWAPIRIRTWTSRPPGTPAFEWLDRSSKGRSIRLTEEEQRTKLEAMRLYATQYPGLTMGAVDALAHPAILPFEVRWASG